MHMKLDLRYVDLQDFASYIVSPWLLAKNTPCKAIEDRKGRYQFLAPGEHFASCETLCDRDLEGSP